MLRIHYKTPRRALGGDLTKVGGAKTVPDVQPDKRRRLLQPFEINAGSEKSVIQKLESIIRELRHELKDSLEKQAGAIEGLRGEVKDLLEQQTEVIQGLRGDVKDSSGKQTEVLLKMLEVMKDTNTKVGPRSVLIL